tara:strand:- start:19 stop:933 length:915 start_codon:yes stop_codon:yes gene_type:complete
MAGTKYNCGSSAGVSDALRATAAQRPHARGKPLQGDPLKEMLQFVDLYTLPNLLLVSREMKACVPGHNRRFAERLFVVIPYVHPKLQYSPSEDDDALEKLDEDVYAYYKRSNRIELMQRGCHHVPCDAHNSCRELCWQETRIPLFIGRGSFQLRVYWDPGFKVFGPYGMPTPGIMMTKLWIDFPSTEVGTHELTSERGMRLKYEVLTRTKEDDRLLPYRCHFRILQFSIDDEAWASMEPRYQEEKLARKDRHRQEQLERDLESDDPAVRGAAEAIVEDQLAARAAYHEVLMDEYYRELEAGEGA